MGFEKFFIIESNIPNNTKPVGNDAEFKGIAEMSIDVHLVDSRIRGSVGRHRTVSGFIRIVGIIKLMGFLKGFQLLDDAVGIFGIVFRNPRFNTEVSNKAIEALAASIRWQMGSVRSTSLSNIV